jgi:hypothetical protein
MGLKFSELMEQNEPYGFKTGRGFARFFSPFFHPDKDLLIYKAKTGSNGPKNLIF